MIVTIVTFPLARRWTLEEATATFRSTAPRYLGKPGLLRKHYYLDESGLRAGGIYFWESREDADACYSNDWIAMVTAKYGVAPEIAYADVPVTVDNLAHAIEQ
jgi:hypothetical protein